MSEPNPPDEAPLDPVPPPRIRPARPGFWKACAWTIGFLAILYGTMLGVVLAAAFVVVAVKGRDALQPPPGADPNSVEGLPPDLVPALAVGVLTGYFVAFVYAAVACRVVTGRGWTRAVGLRRLPPGQLGLGLLALPGFVVLSEALAGALFQLFRMETQAAELGKSLQGLVVPFHWSFAVLLLGVGPGVVEELWCRGFLGRGFLGRYGWFGGIALTSLFFGLLHVYPPPYVLVTAVMGAGLHFTYVASRSLWVPVTIHLLNNSFAALASMKTIPIDGMERALTDHPLLAVGLAAALLLCAGAAMWTGRARVYAEDGSPAVVRPGEMVPAAASGLVVRDSAPHPLWAVGAVGFSVALLWLLSR